MSKRKTSTVSKHARSSKIAAKSQQANQEIVRSPKGSRPASLVTASTAPSSDNEQEASPALVTATVAQDAFKKTVALTKAFDFRSASAMVRAYQANLLDMAQANMQFTLEFAQRFASIKSPNEFRSVIAEFTSKRLAMFEKYSKKTVELGTKQVT